MSMILVPNLINAFFMEAFTNLAKFEDLFLYIFKPQGELNVIRFMKPHRIKCFFVIRA